MLSEVELTTALKIKRTTCCHFPAATIREVVRQGHVVQGPSVNCLIIRSVLCQPYQLDCYATMLHSTDYLLVILQEYHEFLNSVGSPPSSDGLGPLPNFTSGHKANVAHHLLPGGFIGARRPSCVLLEVSKLLNVSPKVQIGKSVLGKVCDFFFNHFRIYI